MLPIVDLQVDSELINAIHKTEHINHEFDIKVLPNQYLHLRSLTNPKHTAVIRSVDGLKFRKTKVLSKQLVTPKDLLQTIFVDSLNIDEILVSVATGPAGTGKTTLAMAYAIQQFQEFKKPIYLSKPTTMIGKGKAFGAVPGTVLEKMAPFIGSYETILNKMLGNRSKNYVQSMIENKDLNYSPLEFLRGQNFENCTFILDESQNTSWHELNSLITRMGTGCKLILLGDMSQIDLPIRRDETGLWQLLDSNRFHESHLTSCVELTAQYRSELCTLMSEIDNDIRNR